MPNLPDFDDLYVISDLHMGGEPDFQILRETARLAGFIRRLATQTPERRLALVLNGDVIDTLAEDDTVKGYVAMLDAPEVVAGIIRRPAFAPVWDALTEFVKGKKRTLVIVIGNHDVELSLPAVQRMLVERLTGGKAEARARIEFSTTGAGYPCTVGNERVFCTHGNEVDVWNYNLYEDLARLGRRLNVGQQLNEWHPNPGTRMVKDVMNAVKRRYAWIDLLKPEKPAALGGILLTLDPGQARKLTQLVSVVPTPLDTAARDNRLGPGPAASAGGTPLDQLLGPNLREICSRNAAARRSPRADDMLLAAEYALGDGLGAGSADEATLGGWQYAWDRLTGWITGVPKEEALRRALLDWLHDDKTFDTAVHDDTSRDILKSVGTDFRFVVTGHTHLARNIDLGGGRRYLNAGTWIRLIRLTPALLGDPAAFKQVYAVFEDGRMHTLDAAEIGGKKLVLDRTTAVRIASEDGTTRGTLIDVKGNGSGPDLEFQPEA